MRSEDVQLAAAAANAVVQTHQDLAGWLKPGLTLAQIDQRVADILTKLGGRSAFLGYRTGRYPAFPSHACLSLNDVIVHGTAGMTTSPLEPGDVISIDVGIIRQGWIGDAAWTYIIQEGSEDARRLCQCGIESLRRGVAALQPGHRLIDWARAVQTTVESDYGYHCVSGLGGHGYGRRLHQGPYVANTLPAYPGEWPDSNRILRPGDLLAVEPMVAIGTSATHQRPRQWPIRTADGSLAVHFEHDVLITPEGPNVLTRDLETLPLIVGS